MQLDVLGLITNNTFVILGKINVCVGFLSYARNQGKTIGNCILVTNAHIKKRALALFFYVFT